MTLTVTVTATVTQDGMRSTAETTTNGRRSFASEFSCKAVRCGSALRAPAGGDEAEELIVALDCVEIDQLADTAEIVAAQNLADRVSAMLTKLIRSV